MIDNIIQSVTEKLSSLPYIPKIRKQSQWQSQLQ